MLTVAESWRETERNGVLRRVDWRFLLPNEHPKRAICFGNSPLNQAISQIAVAVEQDGATDSTFDLAVATNPSRTVLEHAWFMLQPGGVCYIEWTRPVAGGMRGARRRLEAVGFTNAAFYWAWPPPQHAPAQFWLPLGSPAALDYFLSHRPRSKSILSAMIRTAQRVIWRAAHRSGLVMPLFAVAHKPLGTVPGPLQTDWLSEVIRVNWEQWGFGNAPERLSSLLLTGGLSSINKVVSLIFANDEQVPRLIVKRPRVPESIPMLAHEAATLRAVQTLRSGGIPGVPKVLFWQQAGFSALGETVLNGQPIFTLLQRHNYRRLALQVTDWLVQLVNQGVVQCQEQWWKQIAEPALASFENSFRAVIDPTLLGETRAILATLGNLPLTCEQRDFSPWNVLVAPDGELVVLDWESAMVQGLPGLDLIYFVTYLAFFLDGAMESKQFGEPYRATLDAATYTGRVAEECQARYAARTGVTADTLQALRLLVWIIHSRSEYRQLTAEHGGVLTAEHLRNSVFFTLWNIEAQRMRSINRRY